MKGTLSAHNRAAKIILIVEDDAMVRAFVENAVAALGYESCAAGDGHAALRLLEREAGIDLILTDIGLPGSMNGPALAEEARRRRPGLPVLFASGSVDGDGRSTLLPAGAPVLAKPYRKADLARMLKEMLGGR